MVHYYNLGPRQGCKSNSLRLNESSFVTLILLLDEYLIKDVLKPKNMLINTEINYTSTE